MKRKQICCILLILLFSVLVISDNTLLAGPTDQITIVLNGKAFTPNPAPYVDKGTIMVPLRSVAEGFGFSASYNATLKQIELTKGVQKDSFTFNVLCGDYFGANLRKYGLFLRYDFFPANKNSTLFVPIQTAAQIAGAALDWDPNTKTVTLLPLENKTKAYYQTAKKILDKYGYTYTENTLNGGIFYYIDEIMKPLPPGRKRINSANGISSVPQVERGGIISIFTYYKGFTTIKMNMLSPLNSAHSVDTDFYLLLEELSQAFSAEPVQGFTKSIIPDFENKTWKELDVIGMNFRYDVDDEFIFVNNDTRYRRRAVMDFCVGETDSRDSIYSGNANVEIQICIPNVAIEDPMYVGYASFTTKYESRYDQFFTTPSEGATINVRSAPREDAPIIGTIKYGETIKFTRRADELAICQILFNGKFGYITSTLRIIGGP